MITIISFKNVLETINMIWQKKRLSESLKKTWICFFLLLLMKKSFFLEACEIKVGVLLPLSGVAAAYGQAALKGYQLAFEEVQKMKGCHLHVFIEDTESTAQKAALATNYLIRTRHVDVILGPMTTDETNAILPLVAKAKRPLLSPSATADHLTQHPYFSRVCYSDQSQTNLSAWFVSRHLKFKQAVILTNQDEPYSRGLSKAFEEALLKQGGTILLSDFYSSSDIDFKALLGRLRRLKRTYPSFAIFLPDHYMHSAPILRQAHELKIDLPFIGTDGWQAGDVFFDLATQEGTENNYFTSHFDPTLLSQNPQSEWLAQQYQQQYHTEIDVFGVLAYDSVLFLVAQIEQFQKDQSVLLAQLLKNSLPFQGITGTIRTLNGDPLKGGVIMTMKNKHYRFYRSISYEDLMQ